MGEARVIGSNPFAFPRLLFDIFSSWEMCTNLYNFCVRMEQICVFLSFPFPFPFHRIE